MIQRSITEDYTSVYESLEEFEESNLYIKRMKEMAFSVDFVGDQHSAIVDGLSTQVINKTMVKVLAWYDNEINYVSRMQDIVDLIDQKSYRDFQFQQSI